MNRMIIVGSPRMFGRSAQLAQQLFDACIEDCPDDGVTLASVASLDIEPCIGCGACGQRPNDEALAEALKDAEGAEEDERRILYSCPKEDDMADVAEALDFIRRTFTGIKPAQLTLGTVTSLGLGTVNLIIAVFAVTLLIIVDIICEKRGCEVFSLLDRTPAWIRWCSYYVLILMILFSCNLSTKEFLYQGF